MAKPTSITTNTKTKQQNGKEKTKWLNPILLGM